MSIGILFDLDGTLLDTMDDLWAATNYTLKQHGCPARTKEEIRRFVGNGARELIRLALPGNDNDPDVDEVLATYQAHYRVVCDQGAARPYDGILQALEQVREEFPVAVVSNKPDAAVKKLCLGFFGDVYALGETDDCPRKPAPDMVFKAMKELGVDTCIYVGDSEVDVATAKNAGVPCLSVVWGFRDEEDLRNAGGTHFCSDPKQMPDILRKMAKEC